MAPRILNPSRLCRYFAAGWGERGWAFGWEIIMDRISKALSRGAASAGLFLVLLAGPQAALAASDTPRVITVSGEGEVRATPDEAMLSAGVVSNARTAAAALADNAHAMNAVFATLRSAGVPEKSMQTSGFNVSPQYATDKNGAQTPHIVGYQVSNTVNVTVDDLSKVGPVLDALVASGANSVGDISFGIKNPKAAMAQARALAVADAIDRAQALTKAAGVTLGPITSIGESGGYEPPRPMYRMVAGMAAAPAQTPIAAGEQSVTANVSITWEIR
jgi:uncharacterized protein YggE